ncbi:MAG TPA: hypothetical protein VN659_16055 [Pyrinomonadaceae bacterium]|jgi:hypothetical protein|nr:hypothetical protein [Pyrinomonadaceae bacterium]
MNRYESEDEIEKVVRAFETCETGADDFHHSEHLVVAVWYLHTMDRDAALDRMRAGLLRFLDHHVGDTSKYSETITVFYIDKIAAKLEQIEGSIVEKCNTILAADFRE